MLQGVNPNGYAALSVAVHSRPLVIYHLVQQEPARLKRIQQRQRLAGES